MRREPIHMGMACIRRVILPTLLGLVFVGISSCDRLQRGTIDRIEQIQTKNDCVNMNMQVEQFAGANVQIFFENNGSDTVEVVPGNFAVSASDFTRKRLKILSGKRAVTPTDKLIVPPNSGFSIYFFTAQKDFYVFGPSMFEVKGRSCALDTLKIHFP